ncbi:Gfo/Idh/MocA family protein [Maritalea myrionectae]|uniref:Gfo/Idh/MocA family protein n=1 Tax=Maritalea myrionectae TaxID=454601 RepID=UPI000418A30D|nr:Gfo/Idh/MocA family oxidoreductase [Maritalea myrionectae]
MDLMQSWPKPSRTTPTVVIGAGGIVVDAHLPTYKSEQIEVAGIFDINQARAQEVATQWGIQRVFATLADAVVHGTDVIYDLALPPTAIAQTLRQIPEGATVLIQKPMGANFEQAKEILQICRDRNLKAGINFQLRFSPQMLAVRDALSKGVLGELLEIEMHLNVKTPWELWPFLEELERIEIAVHSIHYLDLIRSLVGVPKGVFARTIGDPRSAKMAQTRTSAILDYGDRLRCTLSLNHNHDYGRKFQECSFRFEGDKGAIVTQIGVNLNYPEGEPDELWLATHEQEWQEVPLEGSWFLDAFSGIFRNVQRFHIGEDEALETNVENCLETMALVEACFEANEVPAHPLPKI